ncbi:IMPACT family protein [Spiroplasma turonicum]|uniref:IMPACT family protein n=1 Tax=Spiroplasma turonicum TaxID=216946 RepID=UPI00130EB95D|nr:YigZ family protein [Spiroplasma turonicum]
MVDKVDYFNVLEIETVIEKTEVVKKSKFITYICKISNKDELEVFLKNNKSDNASHNCYAYKYGFKNAVYGYHNDKEPSGTSGEPLLNIINSKNLTNIAILVVRYFGGVKLGTGNLKRAYCSNAISILTNIVIKKAKLFYKLVIKFNIQDSKQIINCINKINETKDLKLKYDDKKVISTIFIKTKELLKEILFKIEILYEKFDYF